MPIGGAFSELYCFVFCMWARKLGIEWVEEELFLLLKVGVTVECVNTSGGRTCCPIISRNHLWEITHFWNRCWSCWGTLRSLVFTRSRFSVAVNVEKHSGPFTDSSSIFFWNGTAVLCVLLCTFLYFWALCCQRVYSSITKYYQKIK